MDVVFESFGAFIAAIIGFVKYKRLNGFYKSLFIQLVIWLILYSISYIVTSYQKHNSLPLNNHWVFNINSLFETTLLLWAATYFFKEVSVKKVVLVLAVIFLVISVLLYAVGDFFTFSVTVYLLESILLFIIYMFILFTSFFEIFAEEKVRLEVWASIGIILYFGCNLPYFSLFNFLNTHYSSMSLIFQDNITDILSNIRYLLLAIGFWLISKRSPISLSKI